MMGRAHHVEDYQGNNVDIGFERKMSIINGHTNLALPAGCLCAFEQQSVNMYATPFVTGGVGNSSAKFPLGCPIYLNPVAVSANTGFQNKLFYTSHEAVDARISATDVAPSLATIDTLTSVFLVVYVDHQDGYWSPQSKSDERNIVTPNQFVDGSMYMYLGKTSAQDGYTFMLEQEHPIYVYDGTNIKLIPYFKWYHDNF